MSGSEAHIAGLQTAWGELAKRWLIEVVERTPLGEVDRLPLDWIASEAAPLIGEILDQVRAPGTPREVELSAAARERVAALAGAHTPELPRELAALQRLMVTKLRDELDDRDGGEFTRAVTRLAEVFGAVQAAAIESLVAQRALELPADPETGLPGSAELYEAIRVMFARERIGSGAFTIARIQIAGTERVAEAYGNEVADRLISAVSGLVASHTEAPNRAFRIATDEFVLLSPRPDPAETIALSQTIADLLERSQEAPGPRIAIATGVATGPGDGSTPEELLDAAEGALWAALADGRQVGIAGDSLPAG